MPSKSMCMGLDLLFISVLEWKVGEREQILNSKVQNLHSLVLGPTIKVGITGFCNTKNGIIIIIE